MHSCWFDVVNTGELLSKELTMPLAVPDWVAWLLIGIFAALFFVAAIGLLIAALPTHIGHNADVIKRSKLMFTSQKLPFPFSSRHR